jgi:hypothetical protein
MNQFAGLLRAAADEVRAYQRTSPGASRFGDALEGLARRMEEAAELEGAEFERAIDAIAYKMTDGHGPITEPFAPSFDKVQDALQRKQKRNGERP